MKHYAVFSEAIREGAKLHPQGFKKFYEDGRTCAFGAGMQAVASDELFAHFSICYDTYPYLNADDVTRSCPGGCGLFLDTLAVAIFHLNDDHRWSREQIADWLSEEEEKLGFILITEEEKSEPIYAEVIR